MYTCPPRQRLLLTATAVLLLAAGPTTALAQNGTAPPADPPASAATPYEVAAGAPVPDYLIGVGDALRIAVWRQPEASAEVVVRPDGKISLPLVNEIYVLGMRPEELRATVAETLSTYISEPTVSVVVTGIQSRQVFITGNVNKPGPYPLIGPTNVLQLITMAGGLLEYADKEHIVLVRGEDKRPDGSPWSFEIDYTALSRREDLQRNLLELKPGDMVIVR